MSERQRQQPFRFWFPYWNTPKPAPQPKPAAPATSTAPQRTMSRVPTSGGRQQSQRMPSPQPTPAASPRRGAQPPSPSSSSSPSPLPSPQRTAAGSASRRGAPPTPQRSPSTSPWPSPAPSPSRRSSRLQPADQRAKQQPETPTSSPSKGGASELPSPTLSSTSLPISSTLESETPLEKAPKTDIEEPSSSSDSLQKDDEKPEEPKLETLKKLDEKPEEKPPVEIETDTKLKQDVGTLQQHKLDEILRDISKERIRFDSEPKQEEKHKPIPVEKREASTPDIKTDSELKQHEAITQQEEEKLDKTPREIPEESDKSDQEKKQDEKPETEEKQETKPVIELTQHVDTEQHVGIAQQEEGLVENLRGTSEEKNGTDLEQKQPDKPVDLKEEFPQRDLETPDNKPHASSSEEREQSIMVISDAKPTSTPQSTTGSESVSDGRVKELEKSEQAKVKEKGISRHGSFGKTSKVSISSAPWAASYSGEQTNFPKEIREGLSKLVQKLSIVHSNRASSDQGGVSIITLAGKNKGATMLIGNEGIKKQERAQVGDTGEKERSETRHDKDAPIAASVNSNVQSVNNSVLNESKCKENNPGVHLILSNKQIEEAVIPKGKMEPLKTQKTALGVSTPQKLTYEPIIRRRCLRGLLAEPSEDDQEDPQKPRRHGCRFSCDGDKKKGRTDDGEGTSKPNNQ